MNNMNYKLKKNRVDSKMINPTWLKSMLAILLALQMVNLKKEQEFIVMEILSKENLLIIN